MTGSIIDGDHPYKTRLVVRRPVKAGRFNGVVVLEWTNVTAGRDLEVDWFQSHAHLIRAGYAWVGISAQRVGVDALKAWSPNRYGTLDVTAGGTITNDALSYDIFSQAARAIRHPVGVDPMGGLRVKLVIGDGESQSATRLATYVNSIHPLAGVIDALLLHSSGGMIRTDLDVPVWKILNETDVTGQFSVRQPDTDRFRTWEIAGTSHSDWQLHLGSAHLVIRDLGPQPPDATCARPSRSRVQNHYPQNAIYDHLVRWIEQGTPPPTAPRITVTPGPPVEIVRDNFGNALGGIRLSEHAVPTAVNTGQNTGPSFCILRGTHIPFDDATLAALYPKHGDYVSAVKDVTNENLAAGYILRADAEETIANARQSIVGRGLPCGPLCQNVGPGVSSITKLRDQTAYFQYDAGRAKVLLEALDKATEAIATGDAQGGDKKARKLYSTARDWLTRYVDRVHDLQDAGTIPAATAGYLVDGANALIEEVDQLIGP
jgi:Alpha/beta hydrolase domain